MWRDRKREAAIDRAIEHENAELQAQMLALFSSIPLQQWACAESTQIRTPHGFLTRRVLSTKSNTGATIEFVRELPVSKDGNFIAGQEVTYTVFLERITFTCERYRQLVPPPETMGAAFEDLAEACTAEARACNAVEEIKVAAGCCG